MNTLGHAPRPTSCHSHPSSPKMSGTPAPASRGKGVRWGVGFKSEQVPEKLGQALVRVQFFFSRQDGGTHRKNEQDEDACVEQEENLICRMPQSSLVDPKISFRQDN